MPHALPRARPKPQSTSRRLRKSEPKKRAKREEKLAEREEKQAEKAAKAAAAPQKEKAERVSRKQARAARIAAEQEEENEDIEVLDPDQSFRVFRRRSRGLNARSILVRSSPPQPPTCRSRPSFTQLPCPRSSTSSQTRRSASARCLSFRSSPSSLASTFSASAFPSCSTAVRARETLVAVAIVATIPAQRFPCSYSPSRTASPRPTSPRPSSCFTP